MAEVGLLPFCPHRSASLPGGAPALSQPFQQAPIYSAPVAGDSLSDARPKHLGFPYCQKTRRSAIL
jgi:hypothetical protein